MKRKFSNWLEKLRQKWGLQNLWQVVAILCVFSLSGSSVVFLRPIFFELVGVGVQTSFVVKTVVYLSFIVPTYQLLLIGYGWLFGQKAFFVQKLKYLITTIFPSSREEL